MKAALESPGPAFHRYRYICPVCCIAPISNRKSGHNPIEQSRLTIYPPSSRRQSMLAQRVATDYLRQLICRTDTA